MATSSSVLSPNATSCQLRQLTRIRLQVQLPPAMKASSLCVSQNAKIYFRFLIFAMTKEKTSACKSVCQSTEITCMYVLPVTDQSHAEFDELFARPTSLICSFASNSIIQVKAAFSTLSLLLTLL